MLTISKYRTADISTIPSGNLVGCRAGKGYLPAIVVASPYQPDTKGVLVFFPASAPNTSAAPKFSYAGGQALLDTGGKLEFTWQGDWEALSDSYRTSPAIGNLALACDVTAIIGISDGPGGHSGLYWNVLTGESLHQNQFNPGVYMKTWLGMVRDSAGVPHEVVKFP